MSKRLTETEVRQLAYFIERGARDDEIAKFFGVSVTTVRGIRTGATHRKITGIEYNPKRREEPRRVISEAEKEKALRLASEGLTAAEIVKVLSRDTPCDKPGYDGIARFIRIARKAGRIPPSSSRVGRPSRRGKRKAELTHRQSMGLARAGDPETFRGAPMRPGAIRFLTRYILKEFEKRYPNGREVERLEVVDGRVVATYRDTGDRQRISRDG